eukprot:Nk52_evm78s2367 gene=Nk52_evmTU78s2367
MHDLYELVVKSLSLKGLNGCEVTDLWSWVGLSVSLVEYNSLVARMGTMGNGQSFPVENNARLIKRRAQEMWKRRINNAMRIKEEEKEEEDKDEEEEKKKKKRKATKGESGEKMVEEGSEEKLSVKRGKSIASSSGADYGGEEDSVDEFTKALRVRENQQLIWNCLMRDGRIKLYTSDPKSRFNVRESSAVLCGKEKGKGKGKGKKTKGKGKGILGEEGAGECAREADLIPKDSVLEAGHSAEGMRGFVKSQRWLIDKNAMIEEFENSLVLANKTDDASCGATAEVERRNELGTVFIVVEQKYRESILLRGQPLITSDKLKYAIIETIASFGPKGATVEELLEQLSLQSFKTVHDFVRNTIKANEYSGILVRRNACTVVFYLVFQPIEESKVDDSERKLFRAIGVEDSEECLVRVCDYLRLCEDQRASVSELSVHFPAFNVHSIRDQLLKRGRVKEELIEMQVNGTLDSYLTLVIPSSGDEALAPVSFELTADWQALSMVEHGGGEGIMGQDLLFGMGKASKKRSGKVAVNCATNLGCLQLKHNYFSRITSLLFSFENISKSDFVNEQLDLLMGVVRDYVPKRLAEAVRKSKEKEGSWFGKGTYHLWRKHASNLLYELEEKCMLFITYDSYKKLQKDRGMESFLDLRVLRNLIEGLEKDKLLKILREDDLPELLKPLPGTFYAIRNDMSVTSHPIAEMLDEEFKARERAQLAEQEEKARLKALETEKNVYHITTAKTGMIYRAKVLHKAIWKFLYGKADENGEPVIKKIQQRVMHGIDIDDCEEDASVKEILENTSLETFMRIGNRKPWNANSEWYVEFKNTLFKDLPVDLQYQLQNRHGGNWISKQLVLLCDIGVISVVECGNMNVTKRDECESDADEANESGIDSEGEEIIEEISSNLPKIKGHLHCEVVATFDEDLLDSIREFNEHKNYFGRPPNRGKVGYDQALGFRKENNTEIFCFASDIGVDDFWYRLRHVCRYSKSGSNPAGIYTEVVNLLRPNMWSSKLNEKLSNAQKLTLREALVLGEDPPEEKMEEFAKEFSLHVSKIKHFYDKERESIRKRKLRKRGVKVKLPKAKRRRITRRNRGPIRQTEAMRKAEARRFRAPKLPPPTFVELHWTDKEDSVLMKCYAYAKSVYFQNMPGGLQDLYETASKMLKEMCPSPISKAAQDCRQRCSFISGHLTLAFESLVHEYRIVREMAVREAKNEGLRKPCLPSFEEGVREKFELPLSSFHYLNGDVSKFPRKFDEFQKKYGVQVKQEPAAQPHPTLGERAVKMIYFSKSAIPEQRGINFSIMSTINENELQVAFRRLKSTGCIIERSISDFDEKERGPPYVKSSSFAKFVAPGLALADRLKQNAERFAASLWSKNEMHLDEFVERGECMAVLTSLIVQNSIGVTQLRVPFEVAKDLSRKESEDCLLVVNSNFFEEFQNPEKKEKAIADVPQLIVNRGTDELLVNNINAFKRKLKLTTEQVSICSKALELINGNRVMKKADLEKQLQDSRGPQAICDIERSFDAMESVNFIHKVGTEAPCFTVTKYVGEWLLPIGKGPLNKIFGNTIMEDDDSIANEFFAFKKEGVPADSLKHLAVIEDASSAVPQEEQSSLMYVKPKPWVNVDGSINCKVIEELKSGIWNLLARSPGIDLATIAAAAHGPLSTCDCMELLQSMVFEGRVEIRKLRKVAKPSSVIDSLFAPEPSVDILVSANPEDIENDDETLFFPSPQLVNIAGHSSQKVCLSAAKSSQTSSTGAYNSYIDTLARGPPWVASLAPGSGLQIE